jgi:RND superfamily putative drug exporter
MFQQMGFGIAVALLIDATIVRSVLVPASMKLLGRWNWYLPSWLEWLPHVALEGDVPAAPAEGELVTNGRPPAGVAGKEQTGTPA